MSKFTLTAKDLEDIAPTLSAALLHPLNILFDDVTDTLGGGDQEVYAAHSRRTSKAPHQTRCGTTLAL